MKRTPIARSTKPMKRSRLRAKALKKPMPPEVYDSVRERSGDWCEAHIEHDCQGRATQMHHIRRRSQGGAHDPSNIKHVCAIGHLTIHANPMLAVCAGDLRHTEHVG
jgi:hypothetical protein